MYQIKFKTIWADFDPNRHMRHTAYSDYAAEVRSRYFLEHDLSLDDFARIHIGPVIFKEETTFFKEIKLGADITVTMTLTAASKKMERWEFSHEIFDDKGQLSARVKVFGAWIDLQKRKLTVLPKEIFEKLNKIPRTDDFKEIPLKSK